MGIVDVMTIAKNEGLKLEITNDAGDVKNAFLIHVSRFDSNPDLHLKRLVSSEDLIRLHWSPDQALAFEAENVLWEFKEEILKGDQRLTD